MKHGPKNQDCMLCSINKTHKESRLPNKEEIEQLYARPTINLFLRRGKIDFDGINYITNSRASMSIRHLRGE